MNLHSIKKRLAVIEAKLPTLGAGKLFRVGKGMLGLRTAIQQAREAAQSALPSAPLGDMPDRPLTPMARLRADMLAEQKRRAERWAVTPLDVLLKEPAITDEDEPGAVENIEEKRE
jgi:hypothetical protein